MSAIKFYCYCHECQQELCATLVDSDIVVTACDHCSDTAEDDATQAESMWSARAEKAEGERNRLRAVVEEVAQQTSALLAELDKERTINETACDCDGPMAKPTEQGVAVVRLLGELRRLSGTVKPACEDMADGVPLDDARRRLILELCDEARALLAEIDKESTAPAGKSK